MRKPILLLIILFSHHFASAQIDTLSDQMKSLLDSMFNNDELLNWAKDANYSYFDASLTAGNEAFSLNNNTLNAGQAETNKIYFTPTITYYHKSGLGIGGSVFITPDNGKMKVYQYAINPSFNYYGDQIDAGISYTHLFKGSAIDFSASPFSNQFYATVSYKNPWLQPGLDLGYSFGKQVEYYDTSFWFVPPPPLQPRIVHIKDTITTKLSSLSASLYLSHSWDFDKIFTKKDALQLQWSLMLNAGSQKWDIRHSSNIGSRRPVLQQKLKNRYGTGSASEKFNLQSLGLSIATAYYIQKFYLQPQVYLDYYLPLTNEKRLSSFFTVTAGLTF